MTGSALLEAARCDLQRDDPLLPPVWRLGGLWPDAVSEVAEGLVKARAVAQSAVDLCPALGVVQRVDVGLHGLQQLLGRVLDRSQDGLAADDHELLVAGDLCSRGENMFELAAPHRL
jgi:hypothetical protein